MDKKRLIDAVFNAGVVGCGGAGFPTHIKLAADADYFVINAAECEPLLRTDRYLMQTRSADLVYVTELIGTILGVEHIYIALKKTYEKEIEVIGRAIKEQKSKVKLFLLENFYPAGDEQMVVREVTGRIVPPAGIPPEVGVIVSNVATVLCVKEAVSGKPVTHKFLTVSGEVRCPIVARVPIGTSFADCIKLAGGSTVDHYRIVSGGPMMGKILDSHEADNMVVTKVTSGIIIVHADSYLGSRNQINIQHIVNRAKSSCIQCSYCTQMCPRHLNGHPLNPHKIMRKLAYTGSIESMLDDYNVKQALICCECGVCEDFACPMKLQPRRVNALLKAEYAKAGIRYQREENTYTLSEDVRYISSKKLAARVGVLEYYNRGLGEYVEYLPDTVKVPFKQHIGAPAETLVKVGDCVVEGQLIAKCPEKALGANIHASIGGIVIATGDCVIIKRKEDSAS